MYRARDGIGTVNTPTPLPATVDYDLWCGPAPKTPLLRKQLHYEWHWFWATGNGEIGNNGIHVIDLCRWALGQNQPPPRTMSIGGRFAFNDCVASCWKKTHELVASRGLLNRRQQRQQRDSFSLVPSRSVLPRWKWPVFDSISHDATVRRQARDGETVHALADVLARIMA